MKNKKKMLPQVRQHQYGEHEKLITYRIQENPLPVKWLTVKNAANRWNGPERCG